MIQIWNGLPGVIPVKKFTDRKKAVARIWKAIQNLVSTPEANLVKAPNTATTAGNATLTAKRAKVAKEKPVRATKAKKANKPATARDGSKKARVVELLRQPNGATLAELMAATQWQAHSVRGFLSGTLGKKMGLTVESTKNDAGERTYRVAE